MSVIWEPKLVCLSSHWEPIEPREALLAHVKVTHVLYLAVHSKAHVRGCVAGL